eukprot:scaffold5640_cov30-Tisochrysis_lutea.AAC.11
MKSTRQRHSSIHCKAARVPQTASWLMQRPRRPPPVLRPTTSRGTQADQCLIQEWRKLQRKSDCNSPKTLACRKTCCAGRQGHQREKWTLSLRNKRVRSSVSMNIHARKAQSNIPSMAGQWGLARR